MRPAAEPIGITDGATSVVLDPLLLDRGESEYLERNRAAWERWAPTYIAAGRTAWQDAELRWGIWGTPESKLHLLDDQPDGADAIELGCGTAAISAWLARHELHPVGVDFARAQLNTATELQREFGVSFRLIYANAEHVQYDDSSFDLAISEYGASLWCDPRRWLPEAHRLLRPGGRLIFFISSPILVACTPADGGSATNRLVRDSFSDSQSEFLGTDVVEFHMTHGHWIRLLRASGFVLENLIEIRPSSRAKCRFDFVSLDWARRWPSEEIWIVRRAG
jgi:SAM-dependent methyltransferase